MILDGTLQSGANILTNPELLIILLHNPCPAGTSSQVQLECKCELFRNDVDNWGILWTDYIHIAERLGIHYGIIVSLAEAEKMTSCDLMMLIIRSVDLWVSAYNCLEDYGGLGLDSGCLSLQQALLEEQAQEEFEQDVEDYIDSIKLGYLNSYYMFKS